MARLNKPAVTPGQAHYVLQRLIAERKISASEVNHYLGEIDREIQELEQRLASLRDSRQESPATAASEARPARTRTRATGAARPGRRRASAKAESTAAEAPAPRRRRSRARRNPAEVAASRKLQGVYLSLIKQVPQGKRDQFRKIAGSAGREEAIRKMRAVLGK